MTPSSLRVMTVVGTRPEIIRLSCTIARLDTTFDHTLVHTGQSHDFELSGVFFDDLGLRPPDHHLAVDTTSLGRFLGGTLIAMEELLLRIRPEALLVLGDTNSSISAVMAKRLQVPVYHMEAGNRAFDANIPEEVNRRLVDHIADFNLVYTEHARRNLLAEGLESRRITLTGTPMAEVLETYRARARQSTVLADLGLGDRQYVLASIHREENVDEPDRLRRLVQTLTDVHRAYELPVLVSTHPRTRARLADLTAAEPDGIIFHKPFGFLDYLQLQCHALCVISDSGTISEESALLGFPAVTVRDATERPEALETGSIVVTGLSSRAVRESMQQVISQRATGEVPPIPSDYQIRNCSQRVANFIRSTAHLHHAWAGIRRRSAIWAAPDDQVDPSILR